MRRFINLDRYIKQGGFSLVETAIVVLVFGIVVAGALTSYRSIVLKERVANTRTTLAAVRTALDSYVAAAGALPCPADISAPVGAPEFGRSTDCMDTGVSAGACVAGYCVADGRLIDHDNDATTPAIPFRVRIGAVPIRDLNLGYEDSKDGWNNRIFYAVTEMLATTPAAYNAKHGAINVVDSGGVSVLKTPGIAHYALFSTGPNGAGSYDYLTGATSKPCVAGVQEEENCNNDATFRAGIYAVAQTPAFYDDFIAYAATIAPAAGGGGGQGDLLTLWTNSHVHPSGTNSPLDCPSGYTKLYDGRGYVFAAFTGVNSAVALGQEKCAVLQGAPGLGWDNGAVYPLSQTSTHTLCTVCRPD